MIDAEIIDLVREKASVEEVARKHGLSLRQEGNLLVGCCPFHDEKTGSFKIFPNNTWHCFGCHAKGDVFTLYQRYNPGVEFPEIVRILGEPLGIKIEEIDDKQLTKINQRKAVQEKYYWLNKQACWYFRRNFQTPGNPALEYMRSRGFKDTTLDSFQIGYAPANCDLRAFIRQQLEKGGKGDTWADVEQAMLECGLLGKSKDSDFIYDRFKNRVMFPICDRQGQIIAFNGRVLDPEAKSKNKYVNTETTPIFKKSACFYGLNLASKNIHTDNRNTVIICEGNTDAMACHQVGINYAIATLGTALTDSHIKTLQKIKAQVFLSFDNDKNKAGEKAAVKAAKMLIPTGLDFKATFTSGKGSDPCTELLGKKTAKDNFLTRFSTAVDGFQWLAEHEVSLTQGSTTKLAAAVSELIKLAAQNDDPILLRFRAKALADLTGLDVLDILSTVEASAKEGPESSGAAAPPSPPKKLEADYSKYTDFYDRNDTGNARRLFAHCGDILRYCHTLHNWAYYNGKHWELEGSQDAVNPKTLCIDLYDTTQQAAMKTGNMDLREYTDKLGDDAKQKRMLAVYKGLTDVHLDHKLFDKDKMALPLKNGVLDLVSGNLRPHDPEEYITNIIDIEYNPSADCPKWYEFMNFISCGNTELADFMQAAVGYSLTGHISEQCYFFLFGAGKNGKSVFISVIERLLGHLAATLPSHLITKTQQPAGSGPQPEIARLRAARLALGDEIPSDMRLDESKMKNITGGNSISCRALYGNSFEFVPQFKIWLQGNHRPTIKDCDYGIWRRCKMIPFAATVKDADPNLTSKLLKELPGILNWALRGCHMWQENNYTLPISTVVEDATQEYKDDSNKTARFYEDCCQPAFNFSLTLTEIYKEYEKWCKNGGEYALSSRKFSEALRQHLSSISTDTIKNKSTTIFKLGDGLDVSYTRKTSGYVFKNLALRIDAESL